MHWTLGATVRGMAYSTVTLTASGMGEFIQLEFDPPEKSQPVMVRLLGDAIKDDHGGSEPEAPNAQEVIVIGGVVNTHRATMVYPGGP